MTKWMTKWGCLSEIVPVEVERETDSSIWINGRRHNRRSSYDNYFDSFEDAQAFLVERAEAKARVADSRLRAALEVLEHTRSLEKPTYD